VRADEVHIALAEARYAPFASAPRERATASIGCDTSGWNPLR